jgi:hypothetical protein
MANFIRLKQIESGSALNTAAQVGNDFSQSVINIITSEVSAVLPEGVVSGSSQIFITGTIGYNDIATDIEVAVISSSLSASQVLISSSISSSIATSLSGSLSSITVLSSSVNNRLTNLESFSSSLDNGFATDAELTLSQSNINIDMGEW